MAAKRLKSPTTEPDKRKTWVSPGMAYFVFFVSMLVILLLLISSGAIVVDMTPLNDFWNDVRGGR